MIGRLDEGEARRWRTGDPAVLRADLDRALAGAEDPLNPPSDAELLDAVRGGTIQAYGTLYARHVQAAGNLARQLARSPVEADDLVSDAFAKVLSVLRTGGGPESAFRAYLLTALRHTAYDKARRDRRLELSDDVEAVPGVAKTTSQPFHDTAVARLDRSLAARAFASLPEHWQTVLWHTAIEGQTPAQVSPLLGLTPNGVSALAYRAREGLRKAYLQAHVERNPSEPCRATAAKLGAWTRGGLSKREAVQVEAHLDECSACRALTAELADVNGALRAVVAPLVLGVGTTGYLAVGAGKASAVASIATGTGASVPQWLGAVASAVLLATAIGSGVDAPDRPVDPTAVAQPPATSTTAGLTTTVGQTTTTAPPASAPPASGTAPGTTSTGGSSAVAPAPTAAAAPTLAPTSPTGFTTSTGGPPTDFPITISNTGSAPAPPPTMTLSLPDDLKVVGPGNNLRGGVLVGLDGATGTVGCPAGKGTVVCAATRELAPGDSVTFVFRLLAGPKAQDGTITATTDSGPPLVIEVPVTIKPKK
ncbi:sigma-70 family RNA polymerase sigma factor [Umezawaea endophytica]|uniref:Sigma-70 family RNA polymerase sigma factor n=1 Tax=Umezawaea endophytica TaxID=1654476 RepID=A0A9X2VJK8_9PSEU|nr:sigma-70 family RNA polymerase sigma factor [Umezawaea endophytica]MCS7477801.1 sigma-70 family RNA polymerase sigma factor [Umezawaea endophytica]